MNLDGEGIASEPRVTPRRPKGSAVLAAAPSPSKHGWRQGPAFLVAHALFVVLAVLYIWDVSAILRAGAFS